MTSASTRCEVPVAHTPAGGYGDLMPPPFLAACTHPLAIGAPDLRGIWSVTSVDVDGAAAATHPALGRVQRIEQCGDRVIVTGGGVVHDMRADGTVEHGVHDVAERDKITQITVVASFEDGVHVLRPVGLPFEVRRRIETSGDHTQLVWDYVGFTARLDRVDERGQEDGGSR